MRWRPAFTRGRWYRGEHRHGAWRVHVLRLAILAQEPERRRAHLASLRRHTSTGPVWLGTHLTTLRFYGVPADPEAAAVTGTLTLMPVDEVVLTVPALTEAFAASFAEAPTGPILVTKENT